MGTFEDIQAQLGPEFFERKKYEPDRHNWTTVCVCGHISRYHAVAINGEFRVPEPEPIVNRGEDWTRVTVFGGCVGALKTTGFTEETFESAQDDRVVTRTIHPTCPCTAFSPVAKVDRPNRFFNQRVPIDRTDPLRHPLVIGIKAFSTHLSRRRAALADPSWPAREFNRRFIWDDDRVCGIPRCKQTDDVFPIYVDGADRSELRCPKHR